MTQKGQYIFCQKKIEKRFFLKKYSWPVLHGKIRNLVIEWIKLVSKANGTAFLGSRWPMIQWNLYFLFCTDSWLQDDL